MKTVCITKCDSKINHTELLLAAIWKRFPKKATFPYGKFLKNELYCFLFKCFLSGDV